MLTSRCTISSVNHLSSFLSYRKEQDGYRSACCIGYVKVMININWDFNVIYVIPIGISKYTDGY